MSINNLRKSRHKNILNDIEFDIETLLRRAEPASEAHFSLDSSGDIISRNEKFSELFGIRHEGPATIFDCPALVESLARKLVDTANLALQSRSSSPFT